MERAAGAEVFGCGSTQSTDITLNIQTTTGGNFSISISAKNTVEHLKKVVSKKLKVSKDRICLLHRERQLREGTLEENGLFDGSRVILLPSVETGLLSQKPENSVMQALESLNDSQVNDFLSGKSPLNLTMRLGDHMMLIQLQLSTLSPGSSSCSSSRSSRSSVSRSSISSPLRITPKKDNAENRCPSSHSTPKKVTPEATPSTSSGKKTQNNENTVPSPDLLTLQNAIDLFRSIAEMKNIDATTDLTISNEEIIDDTTPDKGKEPEQTPIKSLSNMVSNPIVSSNKDEARNENAMKHHSIAKAVEENIKDLMDTIEDSLKESGVILEQAESKTSNIVSCLCDKDENKSCHLCFSINSDSSSSLSINDGSIIVDESLFSKDDSSDFDTAEKSFLSESIYGFTDHSSVLSDCTIDEYPVQSLYNDAIDVISTESLNEVLMEQAAGNLSQSESIIKKSVSEPLPDTSGTSKKRLHCLLHKDAKLKITSSQKQKAYMQSLVNKQIRKRSQEAEPSTSGTARTEPYAKRKLVLLQSASTSQCDPQPSTSRHNTKAKSPDTKVTKSLPTSPTSTVPDTKALIEASKNLTQTLKKLSKEVLTNKVDISNAEEIVRSKIRPGAVIESMKHHGKGIYSGTFSGTLNPALQDRYGRPKRDISTIIHILNDLLCATPPVSVAQKEGARGHACTSDASGAERKCACACPRGECSGHAPAGATAGAPPTEPQPCSPPACLKCDSATDLCQKCQSAKTLALENSKTKCKLEQLRLVMQQKKQNREARKLQARPYAAPSVTKVSPPEPPAGIPEEIDTLA